jgi:hypothetical protein
VEAEGILLSLYLHRSFVGQIAAHTQPIPNRYHHSTSLSKPLPSLVPSGITGEFEGRERQLHLPNSHTMLSAQLLLCHMCDPHPSDIGTASRLQLVLRRRRAGDRPETPVKSVAGGGRGRRWRTRDTERRRMQMNTEGKGSELIVGLRQLAQYHLVLKGVSNSDSNEHPNSRY